ncbi:MAG: (S)-ureidoglycine aminohydrolase [Pirellulales bacterium]|nr:(S)-ureidoglycine aminohydrolase [Pirellulales bacterium]
MNQIAFPFGSTRTRVAADHALIAPDGYVVSPIVGWDAAEGVVQISPAMGAGPRSPRFCQYLVHAKPGVSSLPLPVDLQRFVYVLEGEVEAAGQTLGAAHYAYFPPGSTDVVHCRGEGKLLVFEKPYVPLPGVAPPPRVIGAVADAPCEPFLGDPDAMLATLLPIAPAFDMAVNVFTYQPGATLPFVETHVMEHGLYMSAGQGVYRLGESWRPVQKGDVIWMAAYCPQWFVAMGKEPAQYIYYKDIHRSPLAP